MTVIIMMLTKQTVLLFVVLLGLVSCVLVGAKAGGCDVNAGIERRAMIPKSCEEGVISFEFPWVLNTKALVINARGRKDDFKLCIYSCTDDVRLRSHKGEFRKGETACVDNRKALIVQSEERHRYEIRFRYLDKANLKDFLKERKKKC